MAKYSNMKYNGEKIILIGMQLTSKQRILTNGCIAGGYATLLKFMPIGRAVPDILRFVDFAKWRPSAILDSLYACMHHPRIVFIFWGGYFTSNIGSNINATPKWHSLARKHVTRRKDRKSASTDAGWAQGAAIFSGPDNPEN